MENIYHIGFGVNNEYAKYAGVLMTNIVMTHLGQPICFHIVHDGNLYEKDKIRFQQFSLLYKNIKIFFYDATQTLNNLNPISSKAPPRLHRAVLLRILLPSLISNEIKRILYMDVDMMCIQRLDELWQIDMKGNIVAAAMHHTHTKKSKSWNLSKDRFLSAGLMMIDSVLWNKNNITQKVLNCFQKYSERMISIEEDALNIVLDGDFLDIGDKFNCCINVANPLSTSYEKDTVVLHFFEESKTWTKGCIPKIHDMYWKYVHLSLWNDIEMKEPVTVKSAFLAGVTAEVQKNYKEAVKYYSAVSKRLIEYYVEKNKTHIFEKKI